MSHRWTAIAPLLLALASGLAAADPGLPGLPGLNEPYAQASYSGGGNATAQELAALEKRINDLLEQAKASKESSDRLGALLDRVLNSTGVRSPKHTTQSTLSSAASSAMRSFSVLIGRSSPLPSIRTDASLFTPTISVAPSAFASAR